MGQAVGKKYFINSKTSSGKDKGTSTRTLESLKVVNLLFINSVYKTNFLSVTQSITAL